MNVIYPSTGFKKLNFPEESVFRGFNKNNGCSIFRGSPERGFIFREFCSRKFNLRILQCSIAIVCGTRCCNRVFFNSADLWTLE